MEDKTTRLPWSALKQTEGDIPWPALYEFAAAVVNDAAVTESLVELYEAALESSLDKEHYEQFYVAAVLALAAPQLSDQRRREIGACLLEKLSEAGQEDDDVLMEVLTAACGSMGPVILPAVLQAITQEPNHEGAWFHLWGLTEMAAKADDIGLRERVVRACTDLLTQADQGTIEPIGAIRAAWTLAVMKQSQCTKLLRRLRKKAKKSCCDGDYRNAVKFLEGRLDYTPLPNIWERPVREWFEPRWQMVRDWYSEEKVSDYEGGEQRADELTRRFMQSQSASDLDAGLFEDAGFIVYRILNFAWDYVGSSPEELDKYTLEEVLLDVFPRKVTAGRDLFEKIAPVTECFLEWLESEGILADTARLIRAVRGWKDAIVADAMSPQNWGMAKSFAMRAMSDGMDLLDEEAMDRYIDDYNRIIMERNLPEEPGYQDFLPTIPIVEKSPKIGRNAPCPCGSGRKYKKCCGAVRNTDVNR
jgi:hypothetical protein